MHRDMVSVYLNVDNLQERKLFEHISSDGRKKGSELKRLALEALSHPDLNELRTQIVQDVTAGVIRTLVPVIQGLLDSTPAATNRTLEPLSGASETKRQPNLAKLKGHLID